MNVFFCLFFCHVLHRNSRWPPKIERKKSRVDSADTLGVKNVVKISLSRTVSEINMFLHFMEKFKMPIRMAGKLFLGKVAS